MTSVFCVHANLNFKQQPILADTPPRPRLMSWGRFGLLVSPSAIRGRRECRAPDAPESRVCRGSGRTHTRNQVTPESPGIPRAMVYDLYVLSPVIGLLTPSPAKKPASLTPAARSQDHKS